MGEVTLWKRKSRGQRDQFVVVKETDLDPFFRDYISKGNLTRRLDALDGCANVCGVLGWAVVNESRARIVPEFCDLGSLEPLVQDYRAAALCFPEHFLWHVYLTLARALCFCRYGSDDGTPRPKWEEFVHGDITSGNGERSSGHVAASLPTLIQRATLLLCSPGPGEIDPVVKLSDFGALGRASYSGAQRSTYVPNRFLAGEMLRVPVHPSGPAVWSAPLTALHFQLTASRTQAVGFQAGEEVRYQHHLNR
ncbi:MAG: hypothetical protein M1826_001558 [Phylliscum demangeonii]|nr:MAG: hypothetical protein M1826_001558 [Phylliscum demangeonii]